MFFYLWSLNIILRLFFKKSKYNLTSVSIIWWKKEMEYEDFSENHSWNQVNLNICLLVVIWFLKNNYLKMFHKENICVLLLASNSSPDTWYPVNVSTLLDSSFNAQKIFRDIRCGVNYVWGFDLWVIRLW